MFYAYQARIWSLRVTVVLHLYRLTSIFSFLSLIVFGLAGVASYYDHRLQIVYLRRPKPSPELEGLKLISAQFLLRWCNRPKFEKSCEETYKMLEDSEHSLPLTTHLTPSMLYMATEQKMLLLPTKFVDFVVGPKSISKPGSGELLIEVYSTSLNPVDWKIHKYGFLAENFPTALGIDLAGDVEEVGEGVTAFVKGVRHFFPFC